jgi:hypothetical protein
MERVRQQNTAQTPTINDVLNCIPAINSLYKDSGLTLRDILVAGQVSRAFLNSFEQSDVYLLYCEEPPPDGMSRRKWVLVHVGVASQFRQEWLESWDEAHFPNVHRQRAHQFGYSPEWRTSWWRHPATRPASTATTMVIGATGGTKLGICIGAAGGPKGVVLGGATGFVAGGAVGYFLADKVWEVYLANSDRYRKFKSRVAQLELEDRINTFIARDDFVAACYHCNLSHAAIDTRLGEQHPLQFVEDKHGRLFDRARLAKCIQEAAATPADPVVIPFTPNPGRSGVSLRPGPARATDLTEISDQAVVNSLASRMREINQPRLSSLEALMQGVSPNCPVEEALSEEAARITQIRLADLDRLIDATMSSCQLSGLTIIPSYRAAYAVLRRKIYVLRTALGDSRVQSLELRQVRDKLRMELELQARSVHELAGKQIQAVARIICGSRAYCEEVKLRNETQIKQQLLGELDRADEGRLPVIFTPLLELPHQMAQWWGDKLERARELLSAQVRQDETTRHYACLESGRVIDDGRLVAEDREDHLLDIHSLNRSAVHLRSHQVTRLIQGTSITFRLADLDNDACAEDFPPDKLLDLTLIPSYRTAYAVLARKLCLLRKGVLHDIMQQRGLLAVRDKLQQELVEQKVAHENLAIRQMHAFEVAALIRPDTDWTEVERLKNELEDQLERAENGDQGVQFTPLFAFIKVQKGQQEGKNNGQ